MSMSLYNIYTNPATYTANALRGSGTPVSRPLRARPIAYDTIQDTRARARARDTVLRVPAARPSAAGAAEQLSTWALQGTKNSY